MTTALAFVPSAICAAAAFYLALKGIPVWGWFLIVSLILGGIAAQNGGGA